MLDITLKSAMNKKPISLPSTSLVIDAVRAMYKSNIGAMVVTEDNKIVGIFTERDLVRYCSQEDFSVKDTPLKKVMTKKVKKVDQDTHLADALMILGTNNIRHLPVVDENEKLVGILSLKDISGELLEHILKENL